MNTALLAMVILLQITDAWTAYRLLSEGGRERNKYLRWVIERIGIAPAIVLTKTAYIALLIGLSPGIPAWLLAAIAAAYVLVVSNNAHEIIKSQHR